MLFLAFIATIQTELKILKNAKDYFKYIKK